MEETNTYYLARRNIPMKILSSLITVADFLQNISFDLTLSPIPSGNYFLFAKLTLMDF